MNELENAFQILYAAITENHHALTRLYELIGRGESAKLHGNTVFLTQVIGMIQNQDVIVQETTANLAQARREYEALIRDTSKETTQ